MFCFFGNVPVFVFLAQLRNTGIEPQLPLAPTVNDDDYIPFLCLRIDFFIQKKEDLEHQQREARTIACLIPREVRKAFRKGMTIFLFIPLT